MNKQPEINVTLGTRHLLSVGGVEQIKEDAENRARVLVDWTEDMCETARRLEKVQGLDEVQLAQLHAIIDDISSRWGVRVAGSLAHQVRDEYNRLTGEDNL